LGAPSTRPTQVEGGKRRVQPKGLAASDKVISRLQKRGLSPILNVIRQNPTESGTSPEGPLVSEDPKGLLRARKALRKGKALSIAFGLEGGKV